jgi:transketolase
MTTIAEAPVFDNRVAFADELIALAESNDRVVAVCNDSVGSSNLVAFRERFPERLVNVGIAEQNMVGVGAGLAAAGLIPFVCAAGPFLTGRALEQIKADVAYSQAAVILCGMSPGMAYGELGPTHHSVEDFSWLRALPGLDIVVPADAAQTRTALRQAVENPRPTYLRIGRHKVPAVSGDDGALRRGRMEVVREGSDATIVATGTEVSRALGAADLLAGRGFDVRVVNATYLAPLDGETLAAAARETRGIVTAEEANVSGGLGAAVASLVAQLPSSDRVPMRILGLTEFAPTGSTDYLLRHFGLTSDDIAEAVEEVLADA